MGSKPKGPTVCAVAHYLTSPGRRSIVLILGDKNRIALNIGTAFSFNKNTMSLSLSTNKGNSFGSQNLTDAKDTSALEELRYRILTIQEKPFHHHDVSLSQAIQNIGCWMFDPVSILKSSRHAIQFK